MLVYSERGFRGFFAGCTCRAAWMGLGGFIFLGSFELAKTPGLVGLVSRALQRVPPFHTGHNELCNGCWIRKHPSPGVLAEEEFGFYGGGRLQEAAAGEPDAGSFNGDVHLGSIRAGVGDISIK